MIKTNREQISVIYKHPNSGYYLPIDSELTCDDCTMSRLSMSCYAATKNPCQFQDTKVARIQKEKKTSTERPNKYGEMETSVSLDKYNGKLMNSIWGLYNRNSPHNFKSLQNADEVSAPKEQMMKKSDKIGSSSSFVQFSVSQFNGIVVGVFEAKYEVQKPKTSLEKLENLFTSPIF